MTNELRTYLTEQVNALKNAHSCCAEAKAVCREWLDAVGTDKEAETTKKLFAEVEADIMPVDTLIAFAGSEAGEKVFGAEMAKNVLAHAEEIKKNGAKFCDCPACTACAAIIAKKVEL
ncbi:MAG TPA: molecular chaperone Hsp90 [Candidatus Phascolarctobacterium stercoravium]|nr:molecular chaperone Hsp90 [Candidatus Phascolarctobacterium stercoravium]